MKSIFHKFFGAEKEEREADSQTYHALADSTESIHENQRRALIGWIANRMGYKLGLDRTYEGFPDLVFLASCLIEWTGQGDDVYFRVKEMQLSDNHHRCLLEIYEENKQDINLYMPALRNAERVFQSPNDEVWQVYRDVIYAVTQRKFLLIHKSEVEGYKQGKLLCKAPVIERADIPKARDSAKQCFLEMGIPQAVIMSFLLVISEAITNILKHARDGEMLIIERESLIHVVVEDKGEGFPLKLLPNATLMAGYSTKKSLGQGFTLMMKMAEQVLLSTVAGEGSTLILVFNYKEGEKSVGKHSTG